MRLTHLALAVQDQQRSRRFYETYFGFGAGPAQHYDDGVLIIRDAAGFDLALGPVSTPPPATEFLHFGFRTARPDDVRALQTRLATDGVRLTEETDETNYVGFKCLDPDGYTVEAYWEP